MAVGVGLELGPTFIRAVTVARAGSSLKLLEARESACDTRDPNALTLALTRLAHDLRLHRPVVIGMPATSAMLATVTPLIPNPRRAHLAVEFELQQELPVAPSEVVWDFRWLSNGTTRPIPGRAATPAARPSGLSARTAGGPQDALVPFQRDEPHRTGERIRPVPAGPYAKHSAESVGTALVAAVKRSVIEERLACCRQAGLSIKAVALNAVAAVNAWHARRAPRSSASSAAILIQVLNEQAAEWVLWRGDACQVIPMGGSGSEPWWEGLSASWEALRESRLWALRGPQGGAEPVGGRDVAPIGGVGEGATQTATPRSERGPGGAPRETTLPQDAWVSCPASLWPRTQEVLRSQCGLEAQAFEISQIIGPASGAPSHQAGSWIAAVGLALQGLGLARVPLNVLAATQRRQSASRLRQVTLVVSGACALMMAALGASGMAQLRAQRTRTLEALQQKSRLYHTLRPEARALLQHQEQIQGRLSQLEGLAREATVLTRLLAQIAEMLPEGTWLTSLEGKQPSERSRTAEEWAVSVEGILEGRAPSFQVLTQFMDRLKSVAGMTTVQPLSTTVTTDPESGAETIVFTVQIQKKAESL